MDGEAQPSRSMARPRSLWEAIATAHNAATARGHSLVSFLLRLESSIRAEPSLHESGAAFRAGCPYLLQTSPVPKEIHF